MSGKDLLAGGNSLQRAQAITWQDRQLRARHVLVQISSPLLLQPQSYPYGLI